MAEWCPTILRFFRPAQPPQIRFCPISAHASILWCPILTLRPQYFGQNLVIVNTWRYWKFLWWPKSSLSPSSTLSQKTKRRQKTLTYEMVLYAQILSGFFKDNTYELDNQTCMPVWPWTDRPVLSLCSVVYSIFALHGVSLGIDGLRKVLYFLI